MTGLNLVMERKRKGWSQLKAAARLGVSQPYLSLLEKGARPVTDQLARKAAQVFGLSPVTLPFRTRQHSLPSADEDELAVDLATLGYPGFSHLRSRQRTNSRQRKNPAEVLASALQADNLDSRLAEALPWVVLQFPELDWQWLVSAAKLNDLQNRLGFVTTVARRLAEKRGDNEKAALLARQEALLERSRLAREDTLCHDSLTQAERKWLRGNRSNEARRWGLLTDLSPERLSYAD